MDSIPQKRCTKCGNEYPATAEYFKADKRNRSGLHSWCRECERVSSTRWNDEHPERMYENNKNWKHNNPDKVLKSKGNYRRKHTEQIRESYRKQRDENPDRFRSYRHNRNARKRGLPNIFTTADWDRALEYWGHRCAACGRPRGLFHTISADHWIPLSSSDCPGTIPGNIIPLCHSIKSGEDGCNNTKSNRDAHEWLVSRFGEHKAKQIEKRVQDYFEWISSL